MNDIQSAHFESFEQMLQHQINCGFMPIALVMIDMRKVLRVISLTGNEDIDSAMVTNIQATAFDVLCRKN